MPRTMASPSANRGETLELVLVFGQKKLPLLVSLHGSARSGDTLTVGHLSDAVTEVTQIDATRQKLIYRGRTLFKTDQSMKDSFQTTLSSLGVKNGDRIMLLEGRKVKDSKEESSSSDKEKSPVNRPESNQPTPYQDKLHILNAQLDSINERLEQATKTCGKQDLAGLKSCRRLLQGLHEETMRLLETVDSTTQQSDSAPDFRTRRKTLTNALQGKLDQCENHLSTITGQIKCLEGQQSQSGGKT